MASRVKVKDMTTMQKNFARLSGMVMFTIVCMVVMVWPGVLLWRWGSGWYVDAGLALTIMGIAVVSMMLVWTSACAMRYTQWRGMYVVMGRCDRGQIGLVAEINGDQALVMRINPNHRHGEKWWALIGEQLFNAAAMANGIAEAETGLELPEMQYDPMRPIEDAYACQRCGRRDGLDAVIPNHHWATITQGTLEPSGEVTDGRWSLLCLWCIDELCAQHDIHTGAVLYFAGQQIHATSATNDHPGEDRVGIDVLA